MYEVETREGEIWVVESGGGPLYLSLTIGEARHLAGQLLRHADALQYGERYKTLAETLTDLPQKFTPAEEIAGLG